MRKGHSDDAIDKKQTLDYFALLAMYEAINVENISSATGWICFTTAPSGLT